MKVVAVISGGMDSSVMLYHLLNEGHLVKALSIDYGQRHHRELKSAASICDAAGVEHRIAGLQPLSQLMLNSSQTDPSVEVPLGRYDDPSMRATVVPNRNMLLLAVAAAYAISHEADAVAYGAHAGDHAIYPDCRPAFVRTMRLALAACDYKPLELLTPFLAYDKAWIARRGEELKVPFDLTWTCYQGREQHCGKCGACTERREAFAATTFGDSVAYEVA